MAVSSGPSVQGCRSSSCPRRADRPRACASPASSSSTTRRAGRTSWPRSTTPWATPRARPTCATAGRQVVAKILLAVIALAVGVGGIWLLYIGVSALVSLLQPRGATGSCRGSSSVPRWCCWRVFLVYPAAGTILHELPGQRAASSRSRTSRCWPTRSSLAILRNNAHLAGRRHRRQRALGLLIAGLFDRVRREALAKTFIFLPLAISLVGASVIWRFVYAWQPDGSPQIGLLNAIWTRFGFEPVPWFTTSPINIFCRDHDPHLAPDRVRHGRPVGRDQGRVGRDARGGPARRRHASARCSSGSSCRMIRGSIVTVATTIAIVTSRSSTSST